jgi:hypothetical protein
MSRFDAKYIVLTSYYSSLFCIMFLVDEYQGGSNTQTIDVKTEEKLGSLEGILVPLDSS